ncbi:hypothetical protein EHQ68_18245 [Leptospira congkakensis]|uniref:Porin n=1 Tax=Leptospira congkakensis TaxID=2484932 RepID=A0A4Z1AGP9_9LEPT|nr:hypothetical protein [Leptospira congkakensis]TGL85179.1 hypothetical protein EHQ68_18245 [Leptospira congkakensis]TGL92889.1 hypothetical protein EHQ69_07860 [Leptospira congkakensis]TGL95627.1 hypothetical protein EHQ70_10935 [Leptospira congkakensis]
MKHNLILILLCLSIAFVSALSAEPDEKEEKKEPVPEWSPRADKKSSIGNDEDSYEYSEILKLKPEPKVTNFWVYGATIGTPGSLNFNLGYYYKDVVFRVSGSRWREGLWGQQVDVGYSFWKTPVLAHSISVVFGKFGTDPYNIGSDLGHGGQYNYKTGVNIPGYQNANISETDMMIRSAVAEANPDLALYLDYESRNNRRVHFRQQYVGLTYDMLFSNFYLQMGAGIGSGDFQNYQLLFQMGYLFNTRSY